MSGKKKKKRGGEASDQISETSVYKQCENQVNYLLNGNLIAGKKVVEVDTAVWKL